MHHKEIFDLRSGIEFLKEKGRHIDVVNSQLSPNCEIASYFAKRGGGVPIKNNPNPCDPVIFANPTGYAMPVLSGLFGKRQNCADLLGIQPEDIARELTNYVNNDYPAKSSTNPPCQEVVIDKDIDILKTLPILTLTNKDAGPYITMGLLYAKDPDTGEEDVTIHRLCVQAPDKLTVFFVPGRHIETFYLKAKQRNEPYPISINIGFDPAIYLSAAFTYPTCPLGYNELQIAGAIRGRGIDVAPAVSIDTNVIAHSEIVIEGLVLPEEMEENQRKVDGYALPEFLGYIGRAQPTLPIVQVTAITHRKKPIYQTLIGPGSEQSNILGVPTESSIYKFIRESVTNKITNCYCSHSGAGKLLAFLQFRKTTSYDDSVVRQAGIAAFSSFHELKHVFLVDDDINVFDEREVLWAMTTRFQGDKSIITMSDLNGHPLDPSQSPEFSKFLSETGSTCKTVFDCTMPFSMKDRFERAGF